MFLEEMIAENQEQIEQLRGMIGSLESRLDRIEVMEADARFKKLDERHEALRGTVQEVVRALASDADRRRVVEREHNVELERFVGEV